MIKTLIIIILLLILFSGANLPINPKWLEIEHGLLSTDKIVYIQEENNNVVKIGMGGATIITIENATLKDFTSKLQVVSTKL